MSLKPEKYTFRCTAKTDFYFQLPNSNRYRMVKPGAEFTIEDVWNRTYEKWIMEGYIALINIADIETPSDPREFLNRTPPKGKKFRSIDDD